MAKSAHTWLKPGIQLAYLPGGTTPLLETVAGELLAAFRAMGHTTLVQPGPYADAILTTACFGEQVPWREAPLFTARRRFQMAKTPTVFTLTHITTGEYKRILDHLRTALFRQPLDPADFRFDGLSERAHHVLIEQGRRAGPILSLLRLVQAQTKSLRVLLLVGDDLPWRVYHFDLAGAYPFSEAADPQAFYRDIVLRMVTALSTREISQHQVAGEPVLRAEWQGLSTPRDMLTAGARFGERGFFTEMIRVADLVQVPAVGEAVAAQYSEGCYATWEPLLDALIATVTGRARPVIKDNITEDDLAVITGIRPDGLGALVRHVEGSRNLAASSEAVEMMAIDSMLPRIPLSLGAVDRSVPVARSKVHGHRSIECYDPRLVEYVPMAEPYQTYLVSCGTDAQAWGIRDAFARSQALRDPADPRRLVFTILPGHGVVITEKWQEGKAPFQLIWEAMDAGALVVGSRLPQSEIRYKQAGAQMALDPACLSDL